MEKKNSSKEKSDASKKEQIGFHEGALSTLVKEREELVKTLGIVEKLMQMHMNALSELGVDLKQSPAGEQTSQESKKKAKKKPIDEFLS